MKMHRSAKYILSLAIIPTALSLPVTAAERPAADEVRSSTMSVWGRPRRTTSMPLESGSTVSPRPVGVDAPNKPYTTTKAKAKADPSTATDIEEPAPEEPPAPPVYRPKATSDTLAPGNARAGGEYRRGSDSIAAISSASPLFGLDQATEVSSRTRRFHLQPHITFAATYDSNIFANENDEKGDFIFTIAPGIGVTYGTEESTLSLVGDYTAAFNFFTSESGANSIDNHVNLELRAKFDRLSLGFRVGFESTTAADADVGDRVQRNVYYVGITSEYQLSEKFSIELNTDYTLSDYESLLDASEVRGQLFVNYLISPKVRLGIGGTLGLLDVDESPRQTYEQALGRVVWDISQRVSFAAHAGADFRQFDGGHSAEVTPVFGFGFAWTPYDGTTITLDGRRRIYGSASLQRQNYVSTGVSISVRQVLLTNFAFSLSVGYENASYSDTTKDDTADREDNFIYVRPGFQWQVKDWCTLGLYYAFSTNLSSGEGSNDFAREQVTLQATFVY